MLLLLLAFAFTACTNGGAQSPELVGTWVWESSSWKYLFNEDGTGTRGVPDERETFRWSNPEAGRLTIRLESPQAGQRRTEEWDYTVTDTTLAMENRRNRGIRSSYKRLQ